jgi:hypothetical protein
MFGSTKRPSLSVSISDPSSGPRSAHAVMSPHGASKLHGGMTIGFVRMGSEGNGEDATNRAGSSSGPRHLMASPAPAFMRQRSRSYVDETEQTQRNTEEHRERAQIKGQQRLSPTGSSFFDTSPIEERDPFRSGPFISSTAPRTRSSNINPSQHPYHRHEWQSVDHHRAEPALALSFTHRQLVRLSTPLYNGYGIYQQFLSIQILPVYE